MRPPLGEYRTVMAYTMPLSGGIHRISSSRESSAVAGMHAQTDNTDLPDYIPARDKIGSVTGDGADHTRKCHDAIADRGAHSVIPSRKKCQTVEDLHRRSRIKTRIHCVKLLGQRLMAWNFDREVAALQVRIAVRNGFVQQRPEHALKSNHESPHRRNRTAPDE